MSELEGKRIRAYELGKAVGSGGFGTVYQARQDVILREVAVKVIREKYANQPQFIRRFETEARIIARLEHPHIVPLYDYWREPDGAYLIMRWLQGGSLRDQMRQAQFAPAMIVKFLNQIASALALAHERDIIHRDIKPENILLDKQGNAYLTDFGIAVDLVDADDAISIENMSYGSPEYVAPEQLIEKKVSPQSDIYSLGIMLYELLANARPFSGASTQEIVKMQVRNPVPSLKLSRPDLPPEIDTIIWQATAKKPSARYDDVRALALAFQQVAGDVSDVPPQFRMVSRRQQLSSGEADLSTGKMSADSLGTSNLGTSNLGTTDISSSDIDLATADLSGVAYDEYGTDDLSAGQGGTYGTTDLSDVQGGSYGTTDLSSASVSAYETGDLRGADGGSYGIDGVGRVEGDSYATGSLFVAMGTQALLTNKPPNPYKGLSAFQEEDAGNFYGRETLVARLVDVFRDEDKRFLALVGPSGSGKSSLVRAGIIPAMRDGQMLGSEDWYITTMVPGNDPFQSLSEALLQVAVSAPKNWGQQLRDRVDGLHNLLSLLMPEEDAELVLFIDQFEEVFTLSDTEEVRQQFLGALYYALMAPHGQRRLRLILTLRADYLDRPLNYPEFGEFLRQNTEVIVSLSEKDLEAAIRRPIEDNRGLIADNLVSAMLAEVRNQPGALPLVQYALTRMYDNAKENALHFGLYDDIKGISGSLAQSADGLYGDLPEHQQLIARQLFMRLVALADDARATRRRILWSDLVSGIEDRESADFIINTFGGHRLFTLDNDPVTRAPTVDIAHEALIENWDKFQQWIQQNRADLQRRQQLSRSVDEWLVSNRKNDYLAKGTRLGELESLLYSNTLVLSQEERDYLEASQESRIQDERRTRNTMISLAVLAVVAGIMAVVAVIGLFRAESAEETALSNEQIAIEQAHQSQSRALAANAIANIDDTDLALLISIEAVNTNQTYEAINSLLTGIQKPFLVSYLHGHSDAVYSVAYSPDGTIIASAGADNTIRLWDVETRQAIGDPFIGHTLPINRLAFSPDGSLLASGSVDGSVRIWSVADGQELWMQDNERTVWALEFSPDGRFLVTSVADELRDEDTEANSAIVVWNVVSGENVFTVEDAHAGIIYDVTYHPDGSIIASGGADNLIHLWDATTGERVGELRGHANWVMTLAFSPSGNLLISSGADTNLAYWNIEEQTLLGFIPTRHTDWVRDVAFSADGQFIVTASHDNTAKLWTRDGILLGALEGHINQLRSVDFHPMTLQLVTGSVDNDIALWQISLPQNPGQLETVTSVSSETLDASVDRQRFMVYDQSGTIQVWDAATNRAVFVQGAQGNTLADASLSPSGMLLATTGNDGLILVYDVENGELVGELVGHEVLISVLIFTPDSSQLISADSEGVMLRWDMSNFRRVGTSLQGAELGITSMAISNDGQYLAVGGRDSIVQVWNLRTETLVADLAGHEEIVSALIFEQNDTRLISGGRDDTIIIWDFLADNPLERQLTGHDSFITGFAISPNNRYLASSSRDATVRLWDLESARSVGEPLVGHQQQVTGVQFVDNETLLSTGYDGNVIRWDLTIDNWIQIACEMSNRNLTNIEWAQYIQTDVVNDTCSSP